MRQRDPAKAIAVLDLVTQFFGEFGHRWISGMYEDRYGGRCLVSALEIRAVIVAAREIAQAEIDAARDRGRTSTMMQPDRTGYASAKEETL